MFHRRSPLVTCSLPHQHYRIRHFVPILPPQTALGEQHSDSTAQIVCHFAIVCTVYPFNFPFFFVLLCVVKLLSTLQFN